MKIGIIYFVTEDYCNFWEGFYKACEEFFCVDSVKTYYLFTNNETLLINLQSNVQTYKIVDEGWLVNVCRKNEYIISIEDELIKNDYAFYLNGNYKPIKTIYSNELIPNEKEHFLIGLSFHIFKNRRPSLLPFERNQNSLAYIPYGLGYTYFQGGFYGGRVKELLELAHWCDRCYRMDLANEIITCNHDESYLNRYFFIHPPKTVGTEFAKPQEWNEPVDYKAILIDKNNLKWMQKITYEKTILFNPSLHYMLTPKGKVIPTNIINLFGGLGNQMFQYAFYLNIKLRNKLNEITYISSSPLAHTDSQYLTSIFKLNYVENLNKELKVQIDHTNIRFIHNINENADSVFQEVEESHCPIRYYTGYWQSEKYFKTIENIIRNEFTFNRDILNYQSQILLKQIESQSNSSVSIHIRKGDYVYSSKHCNICTSIYYQNSVEYMKSLVGDNCTFYLFSDDPIWVRKNIHLKNSIVIDWNTRNNSWQDMILMSACAHHIIANSSFSWWGAWLGNYPNKKIIAPNIWLNNIKTPDILPAGWIPA